MRQISRWIPSLMAVLLGGAAATVEAQSHRDVEVYAEGGTLMTGAFDFDSGNTFIPDERVFKGQFGETANGTNDPGFSASPGNFVQGQTLGFDILDALRKWDGTDFDAIPTERLFVSLGGSNRQTPTTAATFVAGFNFTTAGANGGFHQHINYFLTTPFSSGIYLLTIQLRVSGMSEPSAPVYIVFNQNATAEMHEAAAEYVRDVMIEPPVCIGDANGDRAVNFTDITAVLAAINTSGEPGIVGDADQSGTVDFTDITAVLAVFGSSCS